MAEEWSFDDVMEELNEWVDEEVQAVAEEGYQRIVERTPVRTGYAKSRWRLSYDKQDGFLNATISNDASYIIFLEEGSSTQAPRGMVEITMTELSNEKGAG